MTRQEEIQTTQNSAFFIPYTIYSGFFYWARQQSEQSADIFFYVIILFSRKYGEDRKIIKLYSTKEILFKHIKKSSCAWFSPTIAPSQNICNYFGFVLISLSGNLSLVNQGGEIYFRCLHNSKKLVCPPGTKSEALRQYVHLILLYFIRISLLTPETFV